MEVEIYADIVFLINFIMDFFIFWIVSKLIKQKTKFLKLLQGSFITAILYCLLIFIPNLRLYYNFFAAVFILMIGIFVSFRPKRTKEFIKLIFLAHVSAFSVGGLGIAIFYYTNITHVIGNMLGFTVSNFSLKMLLVTTSITYIIISLSLSWFKRILIKKQTFYTVKIYYENEDSELNALVDTGNSLHEPISKLPVIIAEFNVIKKFLPDKLKVLFYENKENNFTELVQNILEEDIYRRIRMIPYESLGKQNGMLIGFKPDKVEILKEDKTFGIKDVIIGIYNFPLSKDGAYQGLLNPEVIE